MAENRNDYEVLANGVKVYADQATENEYRPALEKARDAVQSISDYIRQYSQNRQDEDAESAAGI